MLRGEVGARRLLYVVNNAAFFASHRLPLGNAALHAGYEVHLACPPSDALDVLRESGFVPHPVPIDRRRHDPLSEGRALASLVRLYRAVRPDLVHHVTVKPVLYGSIAARITGVPAVVNAMSGLGYLYTAPGARAMVRRTAVEAAYAVAFGHPRTRVIFQNRDDLELLSGRGLVREGSAVLIRGSGVDLEEFQPRPEPSSTLPLVVLPARILFDKGVGEFVEAARLLRERGVRCRCVLVGDPDPGNPSSVGPAQLREWVGEGMVEWWGHRADMPDVLASCHIVCLPSYREGLPKALLEAAASARPVVTCDVPGCREVVAHERNGLLVPPRDGRALADALELLLSDASLRTRFGLEGRRRAEAEFGVSSVVSRQLDIYHELLSVQSSPRR